MSSLNMLVVLGAGQAGSELALHAREAGWAGGIALIGDDPHLAYHRPPLSKDGLINATTPVDTLSIRSRDAYARADVELISARRVVRVDRDAATVHFDAGVSMRYTKLAFTTGGRPRRLRPQQALGARVANVHSLGSFSDLERLRAGFAEGRRLVVIGGGFVGLEVAAAAVKKGLQVVVLEAGDRVLSRGASAPVSAFLEQVHREAGVDVRTRVVVDGFETDSAGQRVTAVLGQGGTRFGADLVVVGVGLAPHTELAASAGLAVDDGILVDECCRTSDPAIVAAGDCARQHSSRYGRALRLESVPNAVAQARSAAAAINGLERPNDGVPWFWSDQYDLKFKTIGLAEGHDRIVLRGSAQARSFTVFHLQGDRIVAADTVNRPVDFLLSKRLVLERVRVTDGQLADDTVSLKSL